MPSSFTFSSFYRQASKHLQLVTVSRYGGVGWGVVHQAQYPKKDLHKHIKIHRCLKMNFFCFCCQTNLNFKYIIHLQLKHLSATICSSDYYFSCQQNLFSDTVFLHVLFARKYFSVIKIPSVLFSLPSDFHQTRKHNIHPFMVKKILTKVLDVLGQAMPTLPQHFLDLTQFEDEDDALHAPG